MSNPPKLRQKLKPARQESDIIISPDGTIAVSFLWDDLAETFVSALAPVKSEFSFPLITDEIPFPVDKYRECRLCPKQCGFDRASTAHRTCGSYELRVATSGLSMGDEPSIRGERGSGVIMLSGCPLRCPSCHNPEMVKDGEIYSINELLDLAKELVERGAENLQFLSPTVHLPALEVLFRELKRHRLPIPIVFKSSGYESVAQLQALEGLVDIYLPDLKFGGCSLWARKAGVPNYFAVTLAAIDEMRRQVGDLAVDKRGVAVRGLLVRHVRAPLPPPEAQQILNFLQTLPGQSVSVLSHFSTLEL